jgi:acetyl-CoA carboxylase alpha subunit
MIMIGTLGTALQPSHYHQDVEKLSHVSVPAILTIAGSDSSGGAGIQVRALDTTALLEHGLTRSS